MVAAPGIESVVDNKAKFDTGNVEGCGSPAARSPTAAALLQSPLDLPVLAGAWVDGRKSMGSRMGLWKGSQVGEHGCGSVGNHGRGGLRNEGHGHRWLEWKWENQPVG